MNQAKTILTIVSIVLIHVPAYAYENLAEGVNWNLAHGKPDVTVTVVNSKVIAQSWSNIPATELQTINTLLWEKHRNNYVSIKDYNKDGFMDIGIIKGSGYGGSNICYAVYVYEPLVYSHNNVSSITVCPNQ